MALTTAGLIGYILLAGFAAAVAAYFFGPEWFSDLVNSTLRIKTRKALESTTTKIERAEDKIDRLAATIEDEDRKLSDSKGTLNHEGNILKRLVGERDQLEADWNLTLDNKSAPNVVQHAKDKLDAKQGEVDVQQSVVNAHKDAVDASRTAIDTARKEIATLRNTVKGAAAKAKATSALKNAARVIEATASLATKTGQLAKDLDGIDEEYEQAQEQLKRVKPAPSAEDAAIANLRTEAKAKENAGDAPDLNTPEGRRAARLKQQQPKS